MEKEIRYYNFTRHWTRRISPHLDDKEFNRVLVRDFNKFTYGRWHKPFKLGMYPDEFENCDWRWSHGRKGPEPSDWPS